MQLGPCGFKPSSECNSYYSRTPLIKDGTESSKSGMVGIVIVDSVGVRVFVCFVFAIASHTEHSAT